MGNAAQPAAACRHRRRSPLRSGRPAARGLSAQGIDPIRPNLAPQALIRAGKLSLPFSRLGIFALFSIRRPRTLVAGLQPPPEVIILVTHRFALRVRGTEVQLQSFLTAGSIGDLELHPFRRNSIREERADRMTELRVLRLCFVYAAFVFGMLSIFLVPALIRSPFPHSTPHFHLDLLGMILIAMRQLILMLPPALAVVSGTAWWTLRKGRTSGRRWAMAASSLFLVYSLPFFVADIAIVEYALAGAFAIVGVFVSAVFFSAFGVTGLAYFSRYETLAPAAVSVRHS